LFTPATCICPQQFCSKVMITQSDVDVHARSDALSSPAWSKHAAGAVGHAANSQFGPVRPTLLPSGHSFASVAHAVAGHEMTL
jgi:hypothetical protein